MGLFDELLGGSEYGLGNAGLGSIDYQNYMRGLQAAFNSSAQSQYDAYLRQSPKANIKTPKSPYSKEFKGEVYDAEFSVIEKSFLPEIVEEKSFLVEFKREKK